MKKIFKTENTFVSNNTPGIAGILYSILANVLGPVIIVATICFVLNFACKFAGVDFDAFVWVEEQIAALPALWEEWSASLSELCTDLLNRFIS